MATLNELVLELVSNLQRDEANNNIRVNGDATATYIDTIGRIVPSIQKQVKDFEDRTEYTGNYVGDGISYIRGQTFNEASAAYVVTADFVSTDFASDAPNYKVSFDLNAIVQAAIDAALLAEGSADESQEYSNQAKAALESFNGVYLGAQAEDPTVDLNGDPLTGGESYWNTLTDDLRYYSIDLDLWSAPVPEAAQSAYEARESAASAAAVPAPQLNPKAFGGGVACTAQGGYLPLNQDMLPSSSGSFTLVLRGYLAAGGLTPEATTLLLSNSNVVDIGSSQQGLHIKQYDNGALRISFGDGAGVIVLGVLASDVLDANASVILSYNHANGELRSTVNGVSALFATQIVDWLPSSVQQFGLLNSSVSGYRDATGSSISEFAWFNTALTDTQAQEIYEQGVSSWLTINPAYQWGETTDALLGWDFTGSWTTFAATIDDANSFTTTGVGGISYTQNTFPVEIGVTYRLTVSGTTTSSNVYFYNAFGSANDLIGAGFGVHEFTATSKNLYIRVTDAGTTDITELSLKRVGCLLHLPMDEGIGYQLHDQSLNHYDALLSTTGASHISPKREGFIRDFSIDAYNGGGAATELVSSSRDILPAEALVNSVTFLNRGSAINHLDFDRSNRTLIQSLVAINTTIGGGGSYGGVFDVSVSQPHTYKNIQLSSTHIDATDLDIRVDYKLID